MQPLENAAILKSQLPKQPTSDPDVRMLKIEADGDPWKGLIKPKIRLTGRWLERAGFSPGNHVHVTCVAPGLIELRSPEPNQSPPPVNSSHFNAASQNGWLNETSEKS